MVSTKFEPTDARKAFPCFDEPHLKATYDITVEHPIRTYALSNFPVMVILVFLILLLDFSLKFEILFKRTFKTCPHIFEQNFQQHLK